MAPTLNSAMLRSTACGRPMVDRQTIAVGAACGRATRLRVKILLDGCDRNDYYTCVSARGGRGSGSPADRWCILSKESSPDERADDLTMLAVCFCVF